MHSEKVKSRNESQNLVKSLTRWTLVSKDLDRTKLSRKTENRFNMNRSITFTRSSITTSTQSN